MVAGKVNETLSKQFSYKGPDGLTDAERRAYEVCKQLSCKHEACYKRYMYQPDKQLGCKELFADWNACFSQEMDKAQEQHNKGARGNNHSTML